MKHGGYEYFMYRAVISCHMLKLKLSSVTSWGKAEHNQTLQSISSDAFTSVFLIPDVSLLTQEQSNLLLVLSIHCVSALSCDKAEAIPSFNVLSSKMCSAIFTSCFELTCVSCPLTKQKLADLMCITQLKKKRLGKVSDTQSSLKLRESIVGLFSHLGVLLLSEVVKLVSAKLGWMKCFLKIKIF